MIEVEDGVNLKQMVRFDSNEKKWYIQFKYYGEFEILSAIKDDIKDDMLYIGNSIFDGSPIFRYYINNTNILDKLKVGDIKGVSVLLRHLKLKVAMDKDVTNVDKSIYRFFNFFLNSLDNNLIKYTDARESRSVEKNITAEEE